MKPLLEIAGFFPIANGAILLGFAGLSFESDKEAVNCKTGGQ